MFLPFSVKKIQKQKSKQVLKIKLVKQNRDTIKKMTEPAVNIDSIISRLLEGECNPNHKITDSPTTRWRRRTQNRKKLMKNRDM